MIQGLKAASVEVDRRMLAELAVSDSKAFAALVQIAKGALPADVNAPKASETVAAAPKAQRPLRPLPRLLSLKAHVRRKGSGSRCLQGCCDGEAAPADFIVKGNAQSNKYHVPGSTWYEQTVAEFWFKGIEAAKAAGFEPAGGEARQQIKN